VNKVTINEEELLHPIAMKSVEKTNQKRLNMQRMASKYAGMLQSN